MSGLGRRLRAIEVRAKEIRLRPYRAVSADLRVPLDLALVVRIDRKIDGLVARGYTERQILEHVAAMCNATVEETLAGLERLAERCGL